MLVSLAKWSKVFVVAASLGFGSTLADIHLDDFASKQSDGQADTCCTTCCPAHNLGPAASVVSALPSQKAEWTVIAVISFHSEDTLLSVFRPPRPTA